MDHIQTCLAARAAFAIRDVRALMKSNSASKKEQENEIFALDIARMTRLHLIYLSFKLARDRLDSHPVKDPKIKVYLEAGCKIFALKQLTLDHQSLYENGYFVKGSGRLLDLSYRTVLQQMRPQLLNLLESFPKSVTFVPSTIGNEYGDIYELQFETAKNSKLNHGIVPSFFETHMKPVMQMHKVTHLPKL